MIEGLLQPSHLLLRSSARDVQQSREIVAAKQLRGLQSGSILQAHEKRVPAAQINTHLSRGPRVPFRGTSRRVAVTRRRRLPASHTREAFEPLCLNAAIPARRTGE